MSVARLFAIGLIFVLISAAWVLLGQSTTERTKASEDRLGDEVARMFGTELEQTAPALTSENGQAVAAPEASDISVAFEHENRCKGLIWFSLYTVRFDASYTFTRPEDLQGDLWLRMALPDEASIDALEVRVGDRDVAIDRADIEVPLELEAGASTDVVVRYTTRGQDSWKYLPQTADGSLRNFKLRAVTNFADIDYPSESLSPTAKATPRTDGVEGVEARWEYSRMLPARNHGIGIVMPSRPSAGYLSARLSLFAPVSLFFFFVVLVLIQTVKGWKLHPINYVLLGAAFFAFHILLAYLVDHVALQTAFWLSALVSVFLVVSYLRLVLGQRSAILTVGAAQLIYLVFFSYAFFWEGWTGLTIVIGAIVTLFIIMQLTGRIDWESKLATDGTGRKSRERISPTGPEVTT